LNLIIRKGDLARKDMSHQSTGSFRLISLPYTGFSAFLGIRVQRMKKAGLFSPAEGYESIQAYQHQWWRYLSGAS